MNVELGNHPKLVYGAISLLLCLFILLQFSPTFHHPALFGDDYMNTARSLDHNFVTHLKGFLAPNSRYDNRPVGNAVYRLLYHLAGVSPMPYIMVLGALHLVNAILAFLLASILLNNRFLGALCALMWAVNFNVGNNLYSFNVIYDNLTFLCWTLCLLLYIYWRKTDSTPAYLGAVTFFVLATRSKEVGVMLPFALSALELATMDRDALRSVAQLAAHLRAVFRRQWLFYAIAILYALFYLYKPLWGPNSNPTDFYYMDKTYRALIDGMRFYLSEAAFDSPLFNNAASVYILFAASLALAAILREKILWWTLFTFVFTLLPVIFFINLRQQIYLYLPLYYMTITIVGLVGFSLIRLLKILRRFGNAVAYAVIILLSFFYFSYNNLCLGFVRDYNRSRRADANEIVARTLRWFPHVESYSRFYFFGFPEGLPNPDLYVAFMPRILYRDKSIKSYSVSTQNQVLDREMFRQDGHFYCVRFLHIDDRPDLDTPMNVMANCTSELRQLKHTLMSSWAPGTWPDLRKIPGVQLVASASEVRAGRDTIQYRLIGMKAAAVDLLYTIDGKLMPLVLDWRLDEHQCLQTPVGAESQKGLYHVIGIRESGNDGSKPWIEADATVRVK